MKRQLKKTAAVFLATAIAVTTLLISPFTSFAVSTALELENSGIAVWADSENVLTQDSITAFSTDKLALLGGINPQKISTSSTEYYLFLPSDADCSALKFWFDGTLSINAVSVTSGEPTNAFESINEGGVSQESTFTFNNTDYSVTVIKSGDVGTVYIDTLSGSLSAITNSDHTGEESGSIMVVQPNGTVDYCGALDKMSGRGNGTWQSSVSGSSDDAAVRASKKLPYNIKLSKSASLLGMASAKKWCLLANVNDKSLVKNQLTYDFAKYIGVNYQPVCKPVDLYVNQQYLGSYQLSEKVEIKSNRLNITDAFENLQIANGTTDSTGVITPVDFNTNPASVYNYTDSNSTCNDIKTSLTGSTATFQMTVGNKKYSGDLANPDDSSGGYLYELEISNRWTDENAGFCAYNRQCWVIKSADYASKDMAQYSYKLLYALGSAVYNSGTVPSSSTTTSCSSLGSTMIYGTNSVTNPAPDSKYTGMSWSDILDAESAVKYYWTQEYFKNMDSSTSSTYFYKDSDTVDSMLYAGPVWDMDYSIGGYDSTEGTRWGLVWTDPEDWYTKSARMYRWRSNDSKTSYSTDAYSPLNFYAALATNCSDFWQMAEKYWYAYISPAVDILTGSAVDKTGVLKSAEEYVGTVSKSAAMNNLRLNIDDDTYDALSQTDALTSWFKTRQSWISNEISQISIENKARFESVPSQTYTGYELTPTTTVKADAVNASGITETIVLEEGVDYTFSYDNNINVGRATLYANGSGIYTGTSSTTFNITKADLTNYTASIDTAAYADMTLEAVISDSNGNNLGGGTAYQWYRGTSEISGATDREYTTTCDDIGSVLTVKVTGDGTNVDGEIISNECSVISGTKPQGYTRTIASWDYDYSLDSTLLAASAPDASEYYYLATSGENQSTSALRASVNAVDYAEIKWSGADDVYDNEEASALSDRAPVMGTSKTDALAWGEYPYFETTLSTAGYESIKFTARLGGTKKGPRDWKLQYSLDGVNYTDVSSYSIVKNKNMELAFDNVVLPDECNNQKLIYIRMVVSSDTAINGTNTIINQVSGDAAVNNIHITGSSLKVVTSLYEPDISAENGTLLYDDDLVTITDNNGGAPLYYTINGGEELAYTGAFNPFDGKSASLGDTATVVAYARFNDIQSDSTAETYTFAGVDIMSFSYDTYSTDVTGGAVKSTGGVYDESGRMTAYADDTSQYVPLWNDANSSFCVSPDDGLKWSEYSGFTYKTTTAGYENITFSCKAYTTAQGPNSVTLQYSTDGVNYYNVKSNAVLSASSALEDLFVTTSLPSACDNQAVLYIRLITDEDLTNSGEKLWNNVSKGNLYVNNAVIGGEDDGTYKMPYTNKSTDYFGTNGTVKYYSPDNMQMTYMVTDSSANIVMSGTYPQPGIQLSAVNGFAANEQEKYTISIYVTEDGESSLVNSRTFMYKGETITAFDYSSTVFDSSVSDDLTSVSSTSGANGGTLSMYPNALSAATLSYSGTYGVKVLWDANNYYYFDTSDGMNNPDPEINGFWLIETSTLGYENITLNLEQLSSNKGPRDWGIAYSTDGTHYTYLENSNARAISNDASNKTVETYGNIALSSDCDNQEKLYIKVFINGGESVDGTELDLTTTGNTGINAVEISGTRLEKAIILNTTVLENMSDTSGTIPWGSVDVTIDGVFAGTTDDNGSFVAYYEAGTTHEITVSGDGIISRSYTVVLNGNAKINAPLMIFDVNSDGYVNAKDYAVICKDSRYDNVRGMFTNFINVNTGTFEYAE